eukprot:scaffold2470_cov158-Ochromonas_danica.AAC.3
MDGNFCVCCHPTTTAAVLIVRMLRKSSFRKVDEVTWQCCCACASKPSHCIPCRCQQRELLSCKTFTAMRASLVPFLVQLFVLAIPFSVALRWAAPRHHAISSCKIPRTTTLTVWAKKKPNKLISDDLWSAIEADEQSNSVDSVEEAAKTVTVKEKQKNKKSKLVSDEVLASILDEEEQEQEDISKTGKKDKKKKNGAESVPDVQSPDLTADASDAEIDQESQTQERKDKPSSRVRFVESSQPDFVRMALSQVEVLYGAEAVLKVSEPLFSNCHCNCLLMLPFCAVHVERFFLSGNWRESRSCGPQRRWQGESSFCIVMSTALRVLAGDLEPSRGVIEQSSSSLRVAFLRQEFIDTLTMTNTLEEELLSSFSTEQQVLKDIAACEKRIEDVALDSDLLQAALDDLQNLQEKARLLGAYNLEPRLLKVLDSMGFTTDDRHHLVSSFSGGWKMRIGLAKMLTQDPNILLLDEPTNHMDLDSVIWLEGFLRKQSLPMVIVSHDREFLDQVCNKIVDFENGATVSYENCNYSQFIEQRKTRLELWKEKYERQQRHIKEEEKAIKKAKNDPAQAQSIKAREQALERYRTSEDIVEAPPKEKRFRFRFPSPPRCGESILEVRNLMHGFGEGKYKCLFDNVDFVIQRGDRVGFIGPNGSGKSTMLKIIVGLETPKKGYSELASTSIACNYYAQNQADALDSELTVLEAVQQVAPSDISLSDMRSLLGQFMFKGDDADKKIRVLSGGEKARVALCRMMLHPANLLLLDEPTNHLDITAKEVLEDALLAYGGSVLIVSHDRYFLSQVTNTIFEFSNKTVKRFDCDYHDYMEMNSGEGGLKEKVVRRYLEADNQYRITNAKEVFAEEKPSRSKNFGGSGVTGGNLYKGVKNAKRYMGSL